MKAVEPHVVDGGDLSAFEFVEGHKYLVVQTMHPAASVRSARDALGRLQRALPPEVSVLVVSDGQTIEAFEVETGDRGLACLAPRSGP